MLFPSEVFLFVFLPVVLGVYYLLLRKTKHLKNIFLLAASLCMGRTPECMADGRCDSVQLVLRNPCGQGQRS